MDAAVETFRGVVNTWECDEMGHMNVRFYVARAMDGVAALALSLGLSPAFLRHAGLKLVPRDQHLRFHRELRPGSAIQMRGGVARADESMIEVYQELVRPDDGAVCATTNTQIGLCSVDEALPERFGASVLKKAHALTVTIPAHGLARGIVLRPPGVAMSLASAVQAGLYPAYRGVVRDEDCDRAGFMRSESFMARISDGIPHLFQALGGLHRDPGQGIGGAALEYRLIFRAFPRAGDVIEMRSGLRAQGPKTSELCNFLFDADSGACIMSSDAVAVMFDLRTRKAIVPAPEVTQRLLSQAIPGLMV